MIYILITILLFVLSYIYDYRGFETHKKIWWYLILILLILLAGLRYRVGCDTIRYMDEYQFMPKLSDLNFDKLFNNDRYQPGWILYVAFLRSISNSFILIQFTNAIIINCVLFSFLKKRTEKKFTAILIYFILFYHEFNFEVMRESLAVAMFLIAFNYFENKVWAKYLLFSLLAYLAHTSALFIILLPILPKIRNTNKGIIIFLVIMVLSNFIYQTLVLPYINYLSFTSNLDTMINNYSLSHELRGNLNFYITFYSRILIPIMLYWLYINYFKKDFIYSNFLFLFLLFLNLNLAFGLFYRFNNYIFIFYILFTSEIISLLLNRFSARKILLTPILFLLIFGVKIYIYRSTTMPNSTVKVYNYYRYYPYYTIFNPNVDVNRERDEVINEPK